MPAEPPVRRDVTGQVLGKVSAHRDRADAGPPHVGDAESLVQVEVRHVGAELARLGQPNEPLRLARPR